MLPGVTALSSKIRNAAIWITVAAFAIFSLFLPAIITTSFRPFSGSTMVGTLALFVLLHGPRQIGWRQVLVLFVLTFVISWSYETSSIATGFPFGTITIRMLWGRSSGPSRS